MRQTLFIHACGLQFLWTGYEDKVLDTGAVCAGFALGSNMIANCSNTTVYVGVTIFALCGPDGVLIGSCHQVLVSHWCRPFSSRSLAHCKSSSYVSCCDFGVHGDCSQGSTVSDQCEEASYAVLLFLATAVRSTERDG